MKSIFLLLIFTISTGFAQMNTRMRELIEERLRKVDGTVAVAIEGPEPFSGIMIKERETFHAASMMKVPVLLELMRRIDSGELRLDTCLTIKNEFSSIVDGSPYSLSPSDDSDTTIYSKIGGQLTLQDLMHRMVTQSSNLATNILVELVGAKRIQSTLDSLGFSGLRVYRGVEDMKAYNAGLNNTVTAFDLLSLFSRISRETLLSPKANDAMIDILLEQKHNDMIPAHLPAGTKCAHKTGSITGVRHDGGIIYLHDGRRYVMIFLSKGLKQPEEAVEACADISRMIYDEMTKRN